MGAALRFLFSCEDGASFVASAFRWPICIQLQPLAVATVSGRLICKMLSGCSAKGAHSWARAAVRKGRTNDTAGGAGWRRPAVGWLLGIGFQSRSRRSASSRWSAVARLEHASSRSRLSSASGCSRAVSVRQQQAHIQSRSTPSPADYFSPTSRWASPTPRSADAVGQRSSSPAFVGTPNRSVP